MHINENFVLSNNDYKINLHSNLMEKTNISMIFSGKYNFGVFQEFVSLWRRKDLKFQIILNLTICLSFLISNDKN